MSKILKNNTASPVVISDVGQTVPASGQISIQSADDLLFAGSDDVITLIGDLTLTVNDGTNDLSISEGIDLIKGLFPKKMEVTVPENYRDSFGRLRISDINNIFESTHVNSEQTEFWDIKLTGGGTKTYVKQKASIELAVGTASGDRALRQTMNYFHYGAGQSFLIRFTGILTAGKTNLTTCLGYYDDNNGLIFRTNDGVFQVGVRSDTSGSVVETWVDQANFNGDKMDGTGPSGLTIDLSKTHIFQLNFQWLGVGSATFHVHIDGIQYELHQFDHANILEVVYMRTPHLPVRYEIENTGVTASASTMLQICTQIANEGKALVGDLVNSVDNDTNTIAINSSTYKPVISMRAKSVDDILIQLLAINTLVTTADDIKVSVAVDQTLTGASWVSHSQFIEKDISATAATGGRHVLTFYVSKDGSVESGAFKSKFRLGQFIDGTRQTVTVSAKTFSNNANIAASITFKEFF